MKKIAGIFLVSTILFSCNLLLKHKPTINEILVASADSLNKRCPKQLDALTKITSVSVLPNKTLQFNYATEFDTTKFDMATVKEKVKAKLFDEFINTPSCKMFRDSSVTIIYCYNNTNGDFLFKEVFSPDTYKGY